MRKNIQKLRENFSKPRKFFRKNGQINHQTTHHSKTEEITVPQKKIQETKNYHPNSLFFIAFVLNT